MLAALLRRAPFEPRPPALTQALLTSCIAGAATCFSVDVGVTNIETRRLCLAGFASQAHLLWSNVGRHLRAPLAARCRWHARDRRRGMRRQRSTLRAGLGGWAARSRLVIPVSLPAAGQPCKAPLHHSSRPPVGSGQHQLDAFGVRESICALRARMLGTTRWCGDCWVATPQPAGGHRSPHGAPRSLAPRSQPPSLWGSSFCRSTPYGFDGRHPRSRGGQSASHGAVALRWRFTTAIAHD